MRTTRVFRMQVLLVTCAALLLAAGASRAAVTTTGYPVYQWHTFYDDQEAGWYAVKSLASAVDLNGNISLLSG